MKKKRYLAILADLDGTVNRGDLLIPGAKSVYEELTGKGIRWMFLSNNATRSAGELALRITGLGLPVSESQVLNSASALIHCLKKEKREAGVLAVAESSLINAIKAAGLRVVDAPEDADIVVAAMDRGFNYSKLAKAQTAIIRGAAFWATNLDPSVPVEQGLRPGAGSIIAAISTAAGHAPDRVFGKPSSDLAFLALDSLGLPAEFCLVIGDRMTTDVLFARNAGIDSALVLSGATSMEDLPGFSYRPNYIFDSIADVGTLFE